jgi:RNA polymerase sigma-70 factor (ECF subfamily)
MTNSKDNISLLIAALKHGDERAFRTLYDRHVNNLKAFINGYTKSSSQTDDIVQDAFIKLWNAKEDLDINKPVKSFLFKTAYNIFIDKYRKKQREANMLDGWMYKRLMEMVKGDEEEKKRKMELVKAAIEKLPPRCKEIFLMSKFEQLKYSEIAERLNISVKTVEAQMGKAFSIIRREVKGKGVINLFMVFIKRSFKKVKLEVE